MKFKHVAFLCLIISAGSFAEENYDVAKEFFVNTQEEVTINSYLNEDPFSLCHTHKTKLYFHYFFGELVLKSVINSNDECSVMFTHEVEMGEEVASLCDLEVVQNMNFTRTLGDEFLLAPPVCESDDTLEPENSENDEENIEDEIAVDDSSMTTNDSVMKSFFEFLFGLFLSILNT